MIEFGTPAFWLALLQIIGADIVLSGDNAVVIALATRSLPPHQQRRAIFWGTFAAVAMRVSLTVVAVTLLKLPALKLIGSVLLLWIAVQLLLPEEESSGEGMAIGSMGAAIRTILIADVVMSVDNIIAIAAVAKGSLLLLVFGLALSIPLVVFTSTFLLKIMERYPIIITLGAALLGYVAGEMAVADPLVAGWIHANAAWLHTVLPAAGALFVVGVGKLLAARAEVREERPLVEIEGAPGESTVGDTTMHKLLLPVDGSDASLRAVDRLLTMRGWYKDEPEIHLLNVQHVLHKDVSQFVSAEDIKGYYHDEGLKELAEARARLDSAGVPCQHHVVIGELAAETIAHFAREHGIGQILMCTHGRSAVADLVLGSVARGVLQHTDVPVTLVR
ncbi:MAG: integral membrane protein TerC [Rhodocyclaceae bacterium]|nr:MAG: integral membrane protein TerC [Rhodocyclaceae bacterium]TND00133.1 MAG: integral membrane protein TerC [Rhodocyclaceae bacterium]